MKVLLIEDNAADAELIVAMLAEVASSEITLGHAERMSQALVQLEAAPVDAVLLDLSLPDAYRLEGIHRIRERFPQLPLVVLTGASREFGVEAMKEGAQDYLLKGQVDGALLLRSLRYAVERQRVVERDRLLLHEKTARAASEQQARLLDHLYDAVIALDVNGAINAWNRSAERIFGWPRGQAIGRRLEEVLPTEFEGDLSFQAVRARAARDGHVTFRSRRKARSGEWIEVEATKAAILAERGAVAGYITINRDVTERKRDEEELRRSEQRFRALIENASDSIVVLDADQAIRFAATDALGFTAEEVVGRPSLDFVHAEDRQAVEASYRDLLARPGGTARFTARQRHKDGSWHLMEVLGRNALADPVVQGVVLNMRDVTEQRRLEEQLLQSQKMEGIGRLAGGVAHDFNNILSVVLTCAEFALKGLQEGDPLRDDLLEIQKAGKRAASLTRQLLAFSRKQVLQPKPLDLNALLAEMEQMLRRIIGEDIDLVQVLAPDLGIVKADPSQVEQVVMNLVVNARDAMPEGGKLTLETANVELDEEYVARHAGAVPGPHVVVAVSDSGAGMDETTMARAFEPFFTTKESGKGTGLGLSTVYGIVKQSGGSIYVYSEPGRGTTFKIYLPREPALTHAVPEPAAATRSGGAETILVVEDDDAVRSVAKRILDAAGYSVLTAAKGCASASGTARRFTSC